MTDPVDSAVGRVCGEARAVRAMLPALSPDERTDLKRLIQHLLTSFNEHERRYARLGLLVEMVLSPRTGEVPPTRLYDELRDLRRLEGEEWEDSTTLSRAYGGWPKAVRAAMRFAFNGTAGRVPSKYRTEPSPDPYTHDEATDAFLTCVDTLGFWPTEPEYDEWRVLANDLARRAGNPLPRYPSRTPWRRLFNTWTAFEAASRRAHRQRQDTAA